MEGYTEASIATGVPRAIFENATVAGPLATFSGADSYVPHPYQHGVALIGDAASTSDPSWGQGLSLTLHDVRLLRDALLSNDDWDAAGDAYAAAHDRDFEIVHETEDWFTRLIHGTGPEADRRRAAVLPRTTQEPDYMPDTFQSGPQNVSLSEERRKEIFGE
jgi:2-polyprenyl-6-methoxyphenol hydroxylase-like FAD-dependent oxidoreductase